MWRLHDSDLVQHVALKHIFVKCFSAKLPLTAVQNVQLRSLLHRPATVTSLLCLWLLIAPLSPHCSGWSG